MNMFEFGAHLAVAYTKKGYGELSKEDILRILQTLAEEVETLLTEGDEVQLPGLGIFRPRKTVAIGRRASRVSKGGPGLYFSVNQPTKKRIREALLAPKNKYLPVLQDDPTALAKLTGRCPSCSLILPVVLPLRCTTCGTTPFERKP